MVIKGNQPFIDRKEIAKDFSEVGMGQALTNAARMSSSSRSIIAKGNIQKYIEVNREMFRI